MYPRAIALQVVTLVLALSAAPPVLAGSRTPQVGTPTVFADGLAGPEGIAFTKKRQLVVGSTTGRVTSFDAAGTPSVLAELGDPLAGITVRRDGSVLAASVAADRVWTIDPATGLASVMASDVGGPNFIVETRRQRVWVSASNDGTIVDVTDPVPAVRASGLQYPNGMAIRKEGRQRYLYVAELTLHRIVRLPIAKDESLGPPEEYATGLLFPDGIAFDRKGNLLVVGGDRLDVVLAGTREVMNVDAAAINWPSNLAFGRGRGFSKKEFYMVNFGLPLGSGTEILRFPYNLPGAKLIQ